LFERDVSDDFEILATRRSGLRASTGAEGRATKERFEDVAKSTGSEGISR
jgi:hypothetical protein